MSFLIGSSHGDTQALFEALEGEHRPPKSDLLLTRIMAVCIGAGLIVAAVSESYPDAPLEGLGVSALALIIVLLMWRGADSHTVVTKTSITHRGGLGRRQQLGLGDVATIEVVLGEPSVLVFHTNDHRSVRVVIVKSVATALGKLDPELFPPERPLPRKWGWIAYGLLALAVIGFIALLIILYQRGLLEPW